MLAERSHQQETVAAGILVAPECQKARTRHDRELVTERGNIPKDGPIMTRVREEQDRASGAEVTLLGTQPSDDGLHVIETRLRFDDRIDVGSARDAIGAARVAGEWDRDFGAPAIVAASLAANRASNAMWPLSRTGGPCGWTLRDSSPPRIDAMRARRSMSTRGARPASMRRTCVCEIPSIPPTRRVLAPAATRSRRSSSPSRRSR
jgi:hypothetical protein